MKPVTFSNVLEYKAKLYVCKPWRRLRLEQYALKITGIFNQFILVHCFHTPVSVGVCVCVYLLVLDASHLSQEFHAFVIGEFLSAHCTCVEGQTKTEATPYWRSFIAPIC